MTIKLTTRTGFKVVKVIKKTGILSTMRELSSNELADLNQETLGIFIVSYVLENLDVVEQDLYELLAEIKGVTPEDIEAQDLNKTIEDVIEIFNSPSVKPFLKMG